MSKIGSYVLKTFVALLPWSVLISVFLGEKIGLPGVRLWKEILLIIMGGVFLYDAFRQKIRWSADFIDGAIIAYMAWLIIISFINGASLTAYIYGLRYDAGFLMAFLLFRRALPLWSVSISGLMRLFLVSGALMLALSLAIRYVFGEMFLTIFGFSDAILGVAESIDVPPIYHSILDSTIIRFQGVLEGPNQMAFFLLVYTAVYATLFLSVKKYRFINMICLLFLGFLIFETYSRSAYLGTAVAFFSLGILGLVRVLNSGNVIKRILHLGKKILIPFVLVCCIGIGVLFHFRSDFYDVFTRHGSTTGHFERMEIGLTRFRMHPWGVGLAQAGPASRAIAEVNGRSIEFVDIPELPLRNLAQKLKSNNADFYFTTSTYYIPESWYVQQLIEGGWVACLLLFAILGAILFRIKKYPYLFGALIAIGVMNVFLHSFESVHSALALMLFLAAFVPVQKTRYDLGSIIKYGAGLCIFLLPWHALFMTFFQCKIDIDTTLIRFWKEACVIFGMLFAGISFWNHRNTLWHQHKYSIMLVALFGLSSFAYIFIPDAAITSRDLLGFRYDVVFLLVFLIGLLSPMLQQYSDFFLKMLFVSTGIILVVFLIWYFVFDIRTMTDVFGYSALVSTFHPEGCLAFAQNVSGHHRLQATFGGPIRFSVFVVWVYMLFLGVLPRIHSSLGRITAFVIVSFLVIVAVIYSYSKTSYIGLIVGGIVCVLMMWKYYGPKISKKILAATLLLIFSLLALIFYIKQDLFWHPGSLMLRQDNLIQTWHMFRDNPLGYGLGSAGPASQIGEGSVLTDFSASQSDFLPESWYLQILIEQGIVGLVIFMVLLAMIGYTLWKIAHEKRDLSSITLFAAFCSLIVMGCFTHVFEEAATSYIFFFLVGIHISQKLGK